MKKAGTVIALIIIALLVVFIVLPLVNRRTGPGTIGGFTTSSVSIDQTWTDASQTAVCEFTFSYQAAKKESESFPVTLGEHSVFVMEELEADSPCRLILYSGREKLWSAELTAGSEYAPGTAPGNYELILEMETGSGSGKVVIRE